MWRSSWPARLARGLWPDRNPLRRPTDRAEAAVAAGLLAAFLAGAPLAALAAGHWAYTAGLRTERAEHAARRQVPATLLQNAPPAATMYGLAARPALAWWRAPGGTIRTGMVTVDHPACAGTVVREWVTASGQLAGPPLTPGQVTFLAAAAATAGPLALGAVLLAGGLLARRRLARHRLDAWDAEWRVVGPWWGSRR
jgi:hypothetical protein